MIHLFLPGRWFFSTMTRPVLSFFWNSPHPKTKKIITTNDKSKTKWGFYLRDGVVSEPHHRQPPGYRRWLRWSCCHGDGLRCSWEKGISFFINYYTPNICMNRHQKYDGLWQKLSLASKIWRHFGIQDERMSLLKNIFTLPWNACPRGEVDFMEGYPCLEFQTAG